MILTEFKDWALAQGSVAKYDDGQYRGQCVSLINQYCYRVLSVPAGSWGNAKDWPSNQYVLNYFDKVSSPQAGDIGVMGSDYGNGYGHIFVYLSANQILEQNGKLPLKVSLNNPYPNPIAILKKKGAVVDKITKEQEEVLSLMQVGALPGQNYDYRFTGKPLTQTNLDQMLQFWSSQPRPNVTTLAPGQYEVK